MGTKPTKPNLPNQTYQTKPTKLNLPNQVKLSLLSILNQTYQTKSLVKAINTSVRSAFGNVSFNASNILVVFLSKTNHKLLLNFFFIQSSNKRNQKPNSNKSPGSSVLVKMKDDQLKAVGSNAMGGSSYIVCQYCKESE